MKKLKFLFGLITLSCYTLIIFSCKPTGAVNPTSYSRLQVINALAGSTPFNFYLNSTIKSTASITFPSASGYVSVNPGTPNFQVSLATTPSLYFFSENLTLKTDSSYSVFVTGQAGTYTTIFTNDSLLAPANGKAKLRFVNASVSSGNLDITINAVSGYKNIPFKGVGKFIEVPAGTYEFKAYRTGNASNLATLSNQILADGKVYTIFARGIVGNTVTTSAFGLSLIPNLLPAIK
jgi:hypothetical protein